MFITQIAFSYNLAKLINKTWDELKGWKKILSDIKIKCPLPTLFWLFAVMQMIVFTAQKLASPFKTAYLCFIMVTPYLFLLTWQNQISLPPHFLYHVITLASVIMLTYMLTYIQCYCFIICGVFVS